ncbi:hypothetical protein [Brachybacterium hainanense]|uniref:DUF222 domain-containing protein n=1 Tax=Brachybacterium hainanense TaxID=1541174 RepID=A0ABV6R9L5_9MICO
MDFVGDEQWTGGGEEASAGADAPTGPARGEGAPGDTSRDSRGDGSGDGWGMGAEASTAVRAGQEPLAVRELRARLDAVSSVLGSSKPVLGVLVELAEAFKASILQPPGAATSVLDAPADTPEQALGLLAALGRTRVMLGALEDQVMLEAESRIRAARAQRLDADSERPGNDRSADHPVVADIALARRTSREKTSRDLAAARRMARHLPRLREAKRTGRLPEVSAAAIASSLGAEAAEVCERVDRILAEDDYASIEGAGSIRVKVRVREVIAQSTPRSVAIDRALRAVRDRYVKLTPMKDGMARLTAVLPAYQGAQIHQVVQAAAESARAAGARIPMGAARADALVEAVNTFCDLACYQPSEDDDTFVQAAMRGLVDQDGITLRPVIPTGYGITTARRPGSGISDVRPVADAPPVVDVRPGLVPPPPRIIMREERARDLQLGCHGQEGEEFLEEPEEQVQKHGLHREPSARAPAEAVRLLAIPPEVTGPVRDRLAEVLAHLAQVARGATSAQGCGDRGIEAVQAQAALAAVRAIHTAAPPGKFGALCSASGPDPTGPQPRLRPLRRRAHGPRVMVHVIATDSALLCPDERTELASLSGYGTLPAHGIRDVLMGEDPRFPGPASEREAQQRAVEAVATAELRRLFTYPASGQIQAVESSSRAFPVSLRELALTRQAISAAPYSNASANQVDHIRRSADGGPSILDNAQGLDAAANYTKEAGGWVTTVQGDPTSEAGTSVRWTNPWGFSIDIRAPRHHPPRPASGEGERSCP